MWIFLNNAFLSIVDKDGDGSTLLVRERREVDLQRTFPGAQVQESRDHDYRFRAQVDREEVARTISGAVRAIRFPNFKSTVKESDRHSAYMKVWAAMHAFQGKS